jgi:hypothetical protein
MLAFSSLPERVVNFVLVRKPAVTAPIVAYLSALDLDHQNPKVRMCDNEVGLTITGTAAQVAVLPGNLVEHHKWVGELVAARLVKRLLPSALRVWSKMIRDHAGHGVPPFTLS